MKINFSHRTWIQEFKWEKEMQAQKILLANLLYKEKQKFHRVLGIIFEVIFISRYLAKTWALLVNYPNYISKCNCQ